VTDHRTKTNQKRDDNHIVEFSELFWPSSPNVFIRQLEVYWKYTSFTVLMMRSQISFVM